MKGLRDAVQTRMSERMVQFKQVVAHSVAQLECEVKQTYALFEAHPDLAGAAIVQAQAKAFDDKMHKVFTAERMRALCN